MSVRTLLSWVFVGSLPWSTLIAMAACSTPPRGTPARLTPPDQPRAAGSAVMPAGGATTTVMALAKTGFYISGWT